MKTLALEPGDFHTVEEFLSLPDLPNLWLKKWFNTLVIVPTGDTHDSGYMVLGLVPVFNGRVHGIVRGPSDVIWRLPCVQRGGAYDTIHYEGGCIDMLLCGAVQYFVHDYELRFRWGHWPMSSCELEWRREQPGPKKRKRLKKEKEK